MQENNPTPMTNSPQTTEVQPVLSDNSQQPKSNNFLVILLSILLFISVAIAGFFSFQTQKLVKELTVLKTEDKVVVVATEESTVEPVEIESSEVDPTVGWKTYTNSDFTYKYPSEWKVGQGQTTVVSDIAGAGITNFKKDMPMYNECMKKDKTDIMNDLMVKYYTYDLGTEACSNQANINNKEIWVTKADGDGYQPGIIIEYNTVVYPKSVDIFDQILSTFKFIN